MVNVRRRSSRLMDRQVTPQSRKTVDSSDAVDSPAPTPAPAMPTLGEAEEPAESITPVATPANFSVAPSDEVPVATPKTNKKATPFLSFLSRTPKNKTPIAPSGLEMHPHHHQTSTAKPLDEARWLGFSAMVAHTEPVKKGVSKIPVTQATPTKAQEAEPRPLSTPEFKFDFRRQSLELSPEAKKLMEKTREEAQKIRDQMKANPDEFGIKTGEESRKIAKPKGKAGRFSDIHLAQFKKMDSIANHPSVRARASHNTEAAQSLKRTQSKAELNKPERSLKRSPSKAELDKSDDKPASRLPRTKSIPSLNKAVESSKRAKHTQEDDASTARPVQYDSSVPATPSAKIMVARSNTGIPRAMSNLTTPTKASLARSQSVKTLKKTTMIPMLGRSPSVQNLASPTKPKTPAMSFKEGMRKTSQTLSRLPSVKSILRNPVRHYSDDPAKIAAGTHIATPPLVSSLVQALPDAPATEPAQKHVGFTASTLSRMEKGRKSLSNSSFVTAASSQSPLHETFETARASPKVSEQTVMAVNYPKLDFGSTSQTARASPKASEQNANAVKYPTLDFGSTSPARRTTVDGGSGDFTFRSDQSIKFESAARGPTIRHVRTSDVTDTMHNPFTSSSKKRKIGFADAIAEDKENESNEDDERPAKKLRGVSATPVKKTPASRVAAGQRGKRQSGLSQARLNLLAQPKSRRG